jgi:predicted TIM-barrel fold metal-dependent hydrolase
MPNRVVQRSCDPIGCLPRLELCDDAGCLIPGDGGPNLKYSNPIHIDDVADDFPDMTVIIAHPPWSWLNEALMVCLHKSNVYIDLSDCSTNYFPKDRVQRANSQLRHKMLFGYDLQLIEHRKRCTIPQPADAPDDCYAVNHSR